jgi:hypothetical protein
MSIASPTRWLRLAIGAILLGLGAGVGINQFGAREVRKLTAQVEELEKEKTKLTDFVKRVSSSRRVGQVDVIERREDADKRPIMVLRWTEIDKDGTLGAPQVVEVVGRQVYFEGMVIKFDTNLVGQGDPDRSESVVMFRRIFGELQPPETGYDVSRASASRSKGKSETELWDQFWKIIDDPKLAVKYGIRTAQCEAPAVPMAKGQTWEVSLDAAGGLNIRKLPARTTQQPDEKAGPPGHSSDGNRRTP